MLQNHLRMFFEFSVLLQRPEAFHLHHLHPSQCLSFARPEGHDLTSQGVFLCHLGLFCQLLLELLYLSLLGAQQCVASSSLGIDVLFLLVVQPAFRFDEFLHCLSSEIQDELVQPLGEVLVVQGLLHVVICPKLLELRQSLALECRRPLGLDAFRLLRQRQVFCHDIVAA